MYDNILKQLATIIVDIYTKSLESRQQWINNGSNRKAPTNLYATTNEYKEKMAELEKLLKAFKKSDDYKFIGSIEDYADEIVIEFKPSPRVTPYILLSPEQKSLLIKICDLFKRYTQIISSINEAYAYMKKNKEMTGGMFSPPPQQIANQFNVINENMKLYLTNLEKYTQETAVLEQQLLG